MQGATPYFAKVRSSSVCELKQVCWLEVTGAVGVRTGKKYEIGFRVSLKPDAFGWGETPLYLMAKLGKQGKYKKKSIYLQDEQREKEFDVPKDRFVIEVSSTLEDSTIYFGLYEVWSGKWKGGLQIHYAFVKEVTS
ncbi:hypothetical protein CDL15_Pgr024801 [Punica granatum]|uniref:Protein PHLOEM PROTEIN 2-LIKE A9-like n=1 Tax=Punica granatum TaxID=22663 RepID=A0A218WJW1_PUNGR|nr:hypothetical protein CDL15_Pgr024801 [Punica granatum]